MEPSLHHRDAPAAERPQQQAARMRFDGGGRKARHVGIWNRRVGAQLVDECAETGTDRKSTRLNSSHLVISYAVFCLKKKKKRKCKKNGQSEKERNDDV